MWGKITEIKPCQFNLTSILEAVVRLSSKQNITYFLALTGSKNAQLFQYVVFLH